MEIFMESLLSQVKNSSLQFQESQKLFQIEERKKIQSLNIFNKNRGIGAADKNFEKTCQNILNAAQNGEKYYDVIVYQYLSDEEVNDAYFVGYEEQMTNLLKEEDFILEVGHFHNNNSGTHEYFGHEVNSKWIRVRW